MKIDSDKSHAVLIDKETGKVHDLGEVTVTKLDGGPLLPDDVLPKGFDVQKSYTWTLKLSKRKGRKFEYAMKRFCMPPKRKYISKREVIDMIFRQYVDTGAFNARLPREEYMKYSKRELRIMSNALFIYTFLHSDFNTPPDPEGHKGDEYFGDPMKKIVKLPQGFEKGCACHA